MGVRGAHVWASSRLRLRDGGHVRHADLVAPRRTRTLLAPLGPLRLRMQDNKFSPCRSVLLCSVGREVCMWVLDTPFSLSPRDALHCAAWANTGSGCAGSV